MSTKKDVLSKVVVRVENWSSFDKGRFNALTAPLGAIVPLAKQLLIPGKFHLSLKIGAQLPPLASDAFLRTHLKVECLSVPLRLCSGSFESWYSGVPAYSYDSNTGRYTTARGALPYLSVFNRQADGSAGNALSQLRLNAVYGPQSLMDYFGVKKQFTASGDVNTSYILRDPNHSTYQKYNILPFVAYGLCYDAWYRNKMLQKPLFARPTHAADQTKAAHIPYVLYSSKHSYYYPVNVSDETGSSDPAVELRYSDVVLGDGKSLLELRQRNYGDDYFTSCMPDAQLGNPVTIDTSAGYFSVAALREGNALQHFAELNQVAGPDYVQANKARYGVDLSFGVAQRPILHGSADFPMFTSGVEQASNAVASTLATANPFGSVGARYGRAHAEGNDFVCDVNVNEPSYLLLLCSLVPEANYAQGVDKDMRRFTETGDLADLPVSALEGTGFEPVHQDELDAVEATAANVFGYQPQYTYHKLGGPGNEVHGLFRKGCSLASFVPQRSLGVGSVLGTNFLQVKKTDLDNVMAVSGSLSQYGVMIDSYIDLRVSEPLGESTLPSLINPGEEHGKALYINKNGISI